MDETEVLLANSVLCDYSQSRINPTHLCVVAGLLVARLVLGRCVMFAACWWLMPGCCWQVVAQHVISSFYISFEFTLPALVMMGFGFGDICLCCRAVKLLQSDSEMFSCC